LLFAGQGAQAVGMGKDLAGAFPAAQVPVAHAQILGQLVEGLVALEQEVNGVPLEGFVKLSSFRFRFHRLGAWLSQPLPLPVHGIETC
jgi:hypothetical protein